jgi:hypothetical protein
MDVSDLKALKFDTVEREFYYEYNIDPYIWGDSRVKLGGFISRGIGKQAYKDMYIVWGDYYINEIEKRFHGISVDTGYSSKVFERIQYAGTLYPLDTCRLIHINPKLTYLKVKMTLVLLELGKKMQVFPFFDDYNHIPKYDIYRANCYLIYRIINADM